MIIERRYAVAVGCIWLMSGVALLAVTLQGSAGDECEHCVENIELTAKVCTMYKGQACVFEDHELEVILSIAVIGIGP